MIDEIIMKAILTIVGFLVTAILGYLTAKIKEYRKKDTVQQEALKCLIRSGITSKYYVYNELKYIPSYEKENLNYMYEQYVSMGGNSYINKIMEEINALPLKK